MPKAAQTKSSSSSTDGTCTWREFMSRRTAELKDEDPEQTGAKRQKQIQAEWKESDENPKNVNDN